MNFNKTFRLNAERWFIRTTTSKQWPASPITAPSRNDMRLYAIWLGKRGESYACWWLRRHRGMKILETNYRHGHHEIDIIARDGLVTVFVEVRTLTDDYLQSPSASITPTKKTNLHKAAAGWRKERRHQNHWRYDIVGIVWPDPEKPPLKVDHWEKAI